MNACYEAVPQALKVQPKAKGKLKVQMDELWSFVDHKGNNQWVWLALDVDTREIIGCHIGDSLKATLRDRSRESARALWQSLPGVYRQCATVCLSIGIKSDLRRLISTVKPLIALRQLG